MDKLQCVIERVTYHNEENGYSVIKVSAKDFNDIIAAVGIMPEVHIGSMFNLYGSWYVNPKYGNEFRFQKCEEVLPATVNGIVKYLGGGLIKGIGSVFAEKIVQQFGDKTLDILDNDPDRLAEVPGIGTKRVKQIKRSWVQQKEIKNIMLFLQSHDVSAALAAKIYKNYGDKSIDIITENPYRMADEIWGIGFKTADTVASKLGFGHERFERLQSGILYTLNKLSELGHCFSYKSDLIDSASELLEVDKELINPPLEKMIENKKVIMEDNDNPAIYLPTFYYSEVGTAKRLLKLMNSSRKGYINSEINEWAATGGKSIQYDETQLKAINAAMNNKVLVLTGGPGTGKTTTTLGIIRAYREAGAKIILAAPTGRAAKRMSEVTRMEAKTIHRLLGMKPGEGFQKNENNPLTGDILIVDECSMIDIILMYGLLKAVPDNMTLILVGDVDQLPSVGAGKVLSDILESGAIPFIKLEKIFRQAQRSRIVVNAHRINQGEMPSLSDKGSDFLFASEENTEKAADLIVNLCSKVLPHKGINIEDIQVLTPMRRGEVGSVKLNQRLQEALNSNILSLKYGGTDYKIGDKVMQIRNNYDKAVFNGDIGFIASVDTDSNELTVNFDDREVVYDTSELSELTLAYATTIHKSQGSEFPYVVMPLMMCHYMMLQRNLLYTGVTRAKKGLIVVGEKKAIYIAVKNNKIIERNTKLSERLSSGLKL